MAMSPRKKAEKKRGWVVINGDASLGPLDEIAGPYKTYELAMAARCIFGTVRRETTVECAARLGITL